MRNIPTAAAQPKHPRTETAPKYGGTPAIVVVSVVRCSTGTSKSALATTTPAMTQIGGTKVWAKVRIPTVAEPVPGSRGIQMFPWVDKGEEPIRRP